MYGAVGAPSCARKSAKIVGTGRGGLVVPPQGRRRRRAACGNAPRACQRLTLIRIALREAEMSISCAPAIHRSRRSLFSSALVASRSNRACGRSEGLTNGLTRSPHDGRCQANG